MLKKVLIVAATEAEADALRKIPGIDSNEGSFLFGNYELILLVTGVGSTATSWSMMKWFSSNLKPDLAVNIGIAGSYREDIHIGDVVTPVSDCFADAGIETEKGFLTLSEAGMGDPLYKGDWIIADNNYVSIIAKLLKQVKGVTVNTSTGSTETMHKILEKFDPGIETMEGATFFYICRREKVPFVAIRSISNRVEPRNKKNWNIPVALNNLSEKLKDFLLMLE